MGSTLRSEWTRRRMQAEFVLSAISKLFRFFFCLPPPLLPLPPTSHQYNERSTFLLPPPPFFFAAHLSFLGQICYTTDGPEICLVEGLAVADAAVDATESLNAPANDWVVVAGGSGGEGIEDGDGTGSAGLGSSGGDHDLDPDADYVFLEQDGPRAVNTVRGRAAVAPASPVAGAVAPTADFDPAMTDTGDVSDQVTSLTDLARDLFGGPAGESSAGGTLIGASDTAATAVLSVEASEEVDIGVKTRFLGEVRRFRLPAGADLDALTEMVGQLYGLEAGSFCLRTKATPDKVGIDLDSSAVLRAVSVPVATGAASVLHLAVIGL